MAEQRPKFQIHDNPAAVETYANKFVGASFDGGGVTLTFGAARLMTEKTDEAPREGQHPVIYVTQRLTLAPSAAVELLNGLNAILTNLTKAAQAAQQKPAQTKA